MSRSPGNGFKIFGWVILAVPVLFILLYLGSIVFEFSISFLRLLGLVMSLVFPLIGGYFLLRFGYSLFLRPYLRLRRIQRMREYRAWRKAADRE